MCSVVVCGEKLKHSTRSWPQSHQLTRTGSRSYSNTVDVLSMHSVTHPRRQFTAERDSFKISWLQHLSTSKWTPTTYKSINNRPSFWRDYSIEKEEHTVLMCRSCTTACCTGYLFCVLLYFEVSLFQDHKQHNGHFDNSQSRPWGKGGRT